MTKLGRKKDGGYRSGYLRSQAWYARRRTYLRARIEADGELRCACLGEALTPDAADVHHVTYDGVEELSDGRWVARERDEDLMVLCRWCHERIHRVMDRDPGWSRRSRAEATRRIIRTVQRTVIVAAMRNSGGTSS